MIRMLMGIAAFTTMWVACDAGNADTKKVVALPKGLGSPTVEGGGVTVEAAKKAALTRAGEQITELMIHSNPPLTSFKITEKYVLDHLIADAGKPGKDLLLPDIDVPLKSWILTFRNDVDWWSDVVRRDQIAQRKLRAEERQSIAMQIVLSLASLLFAGVGYVRLDEYTHRRYTTWLRLGSVSIVATVMAGMYWLLFPS